MHLHRGHMHTGLSAPPQDEIYHHAKNEITLLRNQSISRHVPIWIAPSQKGKVSPSFNSTGASVISK